MVAMMVPVPVMMPMPMPMLMPVVMAMPMRVMAAVTVFAISVVVAPVHAVSFRAGPQRKAGANLVPALGGRGVCWQLLSRAGSGLRISRRRRRPDRRGAPRRCARR